MSARIAAAFARARAASRAAFIPYLCAGDPTTRDALRFVDAVAAGGADILELGVPFSDPIADGKVNQRAAERALSAGATLGSILSELVPEARRRHPDIGLVLFSYWNPILRMGPEAFAKRAVKAGADAALIVDLPPEEAGPYLRAARAEGLGTVFLAAPTTAPSRLKAIDEASSAFVYYVSRLGVTGTSASLSKTLEPELKALRARISKPVAVGFGISTPDQAAAAAACADAVVVGSALVRLGLDFPPQEAAEKIGALARALSGALTRRPSC